MSATTIDWDQDVEISKEESYQSLQNALNRNQGFGLYFVRSSPVQIQNIIEDIKRDLPNKNIGILPLTDEVDNLFNLITNYPNYQNLNILFISGLELSLLRYEERESEGLFLPSQSAVYGGTWAGIPRILGHLNLSRERFREHFPFSIVFCLPEFALRYFIRRAPDFFDWRSGLFTFPDDQKVSIPTINPRISKLFEWLGYGLLAVTTIILLRINLPLPIVSLFIPFFATFIGFLFNGIIKAIRLKKDKDFIKSRFIKLVWRGIRATKFNVQGSFFSKPKNALSYFNNAIKLDPFYHQAWYNRGIALRGLGRIEEAIASFDYALKIKPDYHEAWYNRGKVLDDLGRYEEAIASYDQALKIKPDKHEAWNNRGNALFNLGRYEEAITSYDQALKIKPDDANAYYNKACTYAQLENISLALDNLKQAINLDSQFLEDAKTDTDFDKIRNDRRFINLLNIEH